MNKQAYITRTGVKQFKPVVTEDQFLDDDLAGFCLACGNDVHGVEPDARKYTCEGCGAAKVYGLQELLIMGLVVIRAPRRARA